MANPTGLKYTKDHELARKAGAVVVVGVTAHAQEALGDVVYVELPKIGAPVTAGKPFGVIESTKAVSELFAPVSGKVVKVNDPLLDSPEFINEEPYDEGWLIQLELADEAELGSLMSAQAYAEFLKETEE